MLKLLLSVAAISLAIASCKKNEKKVPLTCEDEHYTLRTVGYSMSELDTIQLRWYERSSNFTKPLDTLFMHGRNDYKKSGDTILIPEIRYADMPVKGGRPFTYHHDLEFYIPGANRGYRISNIEHANRLTEEVSPKVDMICINTITAYTLDGTRLNTNGAGALIHMQK